MTKQLIMVYAFVGFINIINSQNTEKYLLIDNSKDTIVIDVNKTKYYKIDKNLFEITRYNKVDTICKNKISKTGYFSVFGNVPKGVQLIIKPRGTLISYNDKFIIVR